MNRYLPVSALLLLFVPALSWAGDCGETLVVVGTNAPQIKTYDPVSGKHTGEVSKSLALNRLVLDCEETYGFAKVTLTDGKTVWISRGETARPSETAKKEICLSQANSKDAGGNLTGTNGSGPNKTHCDKK